MNSGTPSTHLNDMFTDFVNYVDSFYGQNDPLYPMMSRDYQCVVIRLTSIALGGMEIVLIVRE